jgi:hypothetical protein
MYGAAVSVRVALAAFEDPINFEAVSEVEGEAETLVTKLHQSSKRDRMLARYHANLIKSRTPTMASVVEVPTMRIHGGATVSTPKWRTHSHGVSCLAPTSIPYTKDFQASLDRNFCHRSHFRPILPETDKVRLSIVKHQPDLIVINTWFRITMSTRGSSVVMRFM